MALGIYINESEITRFFHTRGGFFFIAIFAVAATLAAYFNGSLLPLVNDEEFLFIPPAEWFSVPAMSLCCSLCANLITGYGIVLISKHFNTNRSLSRLAATFFIALQTALPSMMGCFYSGTFMAMIMIIETFLLFTLYDDKSAVKSVFLLFFIITTASLLCIPMLFYIPFLWLGLIQMKVFCFRNLMASFIGIITPFWILLGFGIIAPEDLKIPHITILSADLSTFKLPTLCTILFSAGMGIVFLISNLMKLLSYNAQIRARNGFFILLLFSSIITMAVNTDAMTSYLPILNIAAAYQMSLFFAERRHKRSYIAILVTFIPFVALYLWNLS